MIIFSICQCRIFFVWNSVAARRAGFPLTRAAVTVYIFFFLEIVFRNKPFCQIRKRKWKSVLWKLKIAQLSLTKLRIYLMYINDQFEQNSTYSNTKISSQKGFCNQFERNLDEIIGKFSETD